MSRVVTPISASGALDRLSTLDETQIDEATKTPDEAEKLLKAVHAKATLARLGLDLNWRSCDPAIEDFCFGNGMQVCEEAIEALTDILNGGLELTDEEKAHLNGLKDSLIRARLELVRIMMAA